MLLSNVADDAFTCHLPLTWFSVKVTSATDWAQFLGWVISTGRPVTSLVTYCSATSWGEWPITTASIPGTSRAIWSETFSAPSPVAVGS